MVAHSQAYTRGGSPGQRRFPNPGDVSGLGRRRTRGATWRHCPRLLPSCELVRVPKTMDKHNASPSTFRLIDQTLYHTEPNLAIFLCMYLRTSHKIKTRMLITALGCSSCTQCVAGAELVNLLQVGVLVRRHPYSFPRVAADEDANL